MVPKTESVISSPSSTSLQPNLGVTIPGTTQASETLSSSLPPLWPPTQASATLGVVRSSHSKQKTDENGDKRPPRPPNAWILYRSDCIQKHRENRPPGAPKPTQAELSKLFGEQWRNESDEVKGGYERLAEAAREEHAQKYPGQYLRMTLMLDRGLIFLPPTRTIRSSKLPIQIGAFPGGPSSKPWRPMLR